MSLDQRLLGEDGLPTEGSTDASFAPQTSQKNSLLTRRIAIGVTALCVVAIVVVAAVLGTRTNGGSSSSSADSSDGGASYEAVPSLFSPDFNSLHNHALQPTNVPRNFVYNKTYVGPSGGYSHFQYNVTFLPGIVSVRKFPSITSMECGAASTVTVTADSFSSAQTILQDSPKLLIVNLTSSSCAAWSRFHHVQSYSFDGAFTLTFTTFPANFSDLFEEASITLVHKADSSASGKGGSRRDASFQTPLNFDLTQTFPLYSADGFTLSCDNCGLTTDLTLSFSYQYSVLAMSCNVDTSLTGTITPAITLDFAFQGSYSQQFSGPVPGVSEVLSTVNGELQVGFADIGLSPSFGLNYDISINANAQFNAVAGVSIPVTVDFGLSGPCTSPSITANANPTVNLIGPSATGTASASATFTLSPSVGVTAIDILTVSGSVSPYVTATASGNGQISLTSGGQIQGSGQACLGLQGGVNGEVDASINVVVYQNSWTNPFTIYAQQSLWSQCYQGSY